MSKCESIKRWREQGFTEEEIQKKIQLRWSRGLDISIEKYGSDEGLRRYTARVTKQRENNPICKEYYETRGYTEDESFILRQNLQFERCVTNLKPSKMSMKIITPIYQELERLLQEPCMHGGNKEYWLRLSRQESEITNRVMFFYDFTFRKNKIIIEFHGEYYHEDVDYDSTLSMKEPPLYSRDLFKKWRIEQEGFTVFVIRTWHLKSDIRKMLEELNKRGVDICVTTYS